MSKLRVLDLFSGIGGFSLGLERATHDGEYTGFETVAFCEIEDFPRRVLAKHWPEVPCYRDVRELTAERLATDGISSVDVITGGFPCQDISTAGKGAGLAGERSGLWSEIARLVGELAPRFVIVENVAALLSRGLGTVLGDLASLGYDAEWHCIPASAVGAPHRRDRVWILAYSPCERCGEAGQHCERPAQWASGRCEVLANPISLGRQRQGEPILASSQAPLINRQAIDAVASSLGNIWRAEPNVGRVANGIPDRAHRLKVLGNAVVPEIPGIIGGAILAAMNRPADPLPGPGKLGAAPCDAAPVFSDVFSFHYSRYFDRAPIRKYSDPGEPRHGERLGPDKKHEDDMKSCSAMLRDRILAEQSEAQQAFKRGNAQLTEARRAIRDGLCAQSVREQFGLSQTAYDDLVGHVRKGFV